MQWKVGGGVGRFGIENSQTANAGGVGDGVQESGLKAPIRLHPYPQSFTYQSCIPTKDSQFCSCCSDFSWPILYFKKNRMFFSQKFSIFSNFHNFQIFLKFSQNFLKFFSIFFLKDFSQKFSIFPKNSQKNSQNSQKSFFSKILKNASGCRKEHF